MKSFTRILILLLTLLGLGLLTSCTIRPHANVGLDLNYYGGKFHLDPNVSVGITGYP